MSDSAKKQQTAPVPAGLKERRQFNEDFKLDWHDPDEAHDGYQLKWVGKNYARLEAGTAPATMIYPDEKHNIQKENADSGNLFFTGDNLQVLKHLQNCYKGAVKMIYIDPPYNTGSDGFVYPDRFGLSDDDLRDKLNLTEDEIKRPKILNGRSSHSAWLTFMYPRLKIAKELLSDDGVIFISIDDNEQANLKLLCDEIFSEGNFVGEIIWLKSNTQNDADNIQKNHEYILVYKKFKTNLSIHNERNRKIYHDASGYYYEGAAIIMRGAQGNLASRPNLGYSIYYNKETKDFIAIDDYDKEKACSSNIESEVYTDNKELLAKGYVPIRPPRNAGKLGRWKRGLDKFNAERNDTLIKETSGGFSVLKKQYISDGDIEWGDKGYFVRTVSQAPVKSYIDTIPSSAGVKDLREVFENQIFDHPKSVALVKNILALANAGGGGRKLQSR